MRWAIVAITLSCGPSRACLDRCESFGVARESTQCETLCTEDCETLRDTFGVSEERCHELQAR